MHYSREIRDYESPFLSVKIGATYLDLNQITIEVNFSFEHIFILTVYSKKSNITHNISIAYFYLRYQILSI